MFDGDKNEELKNELNGTIGSGETAGEEAAAGNITGGAADKAPGGAAIGETAGQTVLSGAENKGEPLLGGAAKSEQPEQKFYYQRDKNFIKKSNAKNALVFALLGLLLGPFLGVGIFFSVVALAAGIKVNAKSTTKKWAIIVAIIGIVLNAAFIASLVVALIVYGFYMPPVEGV